MSQGYARSGLITPGADTYLVLASSGDTTPDYLGAKLVAGTNIAISILGPGGAETVEIAFTGTLGTTAFDNDAVTNAKLANMATARVKGRTTAGTGDPEDLTGTQVTALLDAVVGDSGSGGTKGLVPAPAAGDAAALKYLKADGTWATVTASVALDDLTDVTITAPATGAVLTYNGSAWIDGTVALADSDAVSGVLPIANGGTGATTAVDAFLALAPAAADTGDLIVYNAGTGEWELLSNASTPNFSVLKFSGGTVGWGQVNLASTNAVTSALGIGNGGTGQATATNAFNALSPVTTRGDLIVRGVADNVRLAIGSVGRYLRSDGTDPRWSVLTLADATNQGTTTQLLHGNAAGAVSFGAVVTADIAANAVTNALLATVATATFKGRTTAGTGDVEDLTTTQATALLNAFVGDSGSGGAKGLVPAPATGDATKYLRGDGTWASVSAAAALDDLTDVTITSPATGATLIYNGSAWIDGQLDLSDADARTGTLPIGNGGTGQTGATAAFDALSPVTTRGDLIVRGASSNVRLAIGANPTYLRSDGTDPSWAALTLTDARNQGTTTTVLHGNAAGNVSFGAVATNDLAANAVTFAKLQQIATDRLLGRDTAATGDVEALTVGGGVEFTGSGGIQVSAFTGDVTKTAGGTALTIANDAVTYAKLQNVSATDRLLGRSTAGAGDVEEITCTPFARSILDDADAATVRATIGAGTGSGDVVGPASATTNGLALFDGTTGKLLKDAGGPTYASSTLTVPLVKVSSTEGLQLIDELEAFYLTVEVKQLDAPYILTIDVSNGSRTLTVTDHTTLAGGTHSGTNTGDQTITLTGDVTGSGTGSFATTIANDAVTDAKLRNSVALSVIGRSANSTGDPADIVAGSDGDVLRRSGTTLGFGAIPQSSVTNLTTDLSNKQPLDAELTALAGLTSAADKVPYFTGSGTAGVADFTAAGRSMVGAASVAAQTALLNVVVGDSGSGGTKGLVPAPASGDAAKKRYLNADGTWKAVPIVHTMEFWAASGPAAGVGVRGILENTDSSSAIRVESGKTLKILTARGALKTGSTAGTYALDVSLRNVTDTSYTQLATASSSSTATVLYPYAEGTFDSPLATLSGPKEFCCAFFNQGSSPGAMDGTFKNHVVITYIIE